MKVGARAGVLVGRMGSGSSRSCVGEVLDSPAAPAASVMRKWERKREGKSPTTDAMPSTTTGWEMSTLRELRLLSLFTASLAEAWTGRHEAGCFTHGVTHPSSPQEFITPFHISSATSQGEQCEERAT